jgi:hypothetical protein
VFLFSVGLFRKAVEPCRARRARNKKKSARQRLPWFDPARAAYSQDRTPGLLWKFVKLLASGTKVFSLIPHHFHSKIPKDIWQVL